MTQTPRFKIGTTFTPQSRKGAGVHTVTDVLTTRNSKGEVVKIRYEATHEFCGQTLTDTDVLETTIARGLISQPAPTPARTYGTYFCRLRGASYGIKLRAWTRAQAKTEFAAHENLDPKNCYIIVSDTPALGVLFTEFRTE